MKLFEHSVPLSETKLSVEGLRASVLGKSVLRDVSLNIYELRVTAIIGPADAGKSTLLRCLNRTYELTPNASVSGTVMLDGKDIYQAAVDVNALRRRIGFVFGKPQPFVTMSIAEDVLAGYTLGGITPDHPADLVEASLRQVGLWNDVKDRLSMPGSVLSLAEQQHLCLARALALQPEVILLDDPCEWLDPRATAKFEELIRELRETRTIVLSTQSVQHAARVSDFTGFLLEGEMVEFADADQVFTRPTDARTEDYITGRHV
jgi:phosphate transport system ATP-binding protein